MIAITTKVGDMESTTAQIEVYDLLGHYQNDGKSFTVYMATGITGREVMQLLKTEFENAQGILDAIKEHGEPDAWEIVGHDENRKKNTN